jgi:hypothetical protein
VIKARIAMAMEFFAHRQEIKSSFDDRGRVMACVTGATK